MMSHPERQKQKQKLKSSLVVVLVALLVASVLANLFFLLGGYFSGDEKAAQNNGVVRQPELDLDDVASKNARKAKRQQGHWFHTRPDIDKKLERAQSGLTAAQRAEMKRLEAIGYMAGSEPVPKLNNVVVYNKEKAYNGYNLYNSGHGPVAVLMDMKGNRLHEWRLPLTAAIPGFAPQRSQRFRHLFWRRVHLFENGDLLAIFAGYAMIKIDKDSNLIWVYDGKPHHDLFVTEDGAIYTLTRHAGIVPRINKTKPILDDSVCILSPEGKEQKCVSVLEALERSDYAPILEHLRKSGDIFHTNTIEVLDGRLADHSPAFRKGNVLISLNHLSFICIVDMEQEKVVWGLAGLFRKQHQPTILDNGHMLIFDNVFANDGRSRVIEIDPFTQRIHFEYQGTEETPLNSPTLSTAERLPGGNTLITESCAGRAFEILPDKSIVWEFINPNRTGKNRELIATLFEVIRLPPDFPLDWLDVKKPYKTASSDQSYGKRIPAKQDGTSRCKTALADRFIGINSRIEFF